MGQEKKKKKNHCCVQLSDTSQLWFALAFCKLHYIFDDPKSNLTRQYIHSPALLSIHCAVWEQDSIFKADLAMKYKSYFNIFSGLFRILKYLRKIKIFKTYEEIAY